MYTSTGCTVMGTDEDIRKEFEIEDIIKRNVRCCWLLLSISPGFCTSNLVYSRVCMCVKSGRGDGRGHWRHGASQCIKRRDLHILRAQTKAEGDGEIMKIPCAIIWYLFFPRDSEKKTHNKYLIGISWAVFVIFLFLYSEILFGPLQTD